MSAESIPADAGLMRRFREAGGKIAWRSLDPVPPGGKSPRTRVAHLNDEESRVEDRTTSRGYSVVTDSGPVGALVILLEVDRRGPPGRLAAHDGGSLPKFPSGALEAVWGSGRRPSRPPLPLSDLVALARYALA
jgi:hypothetical protein